MSYEQRQRPAEVTDLYAERDAEALGEHYMRHLSAMTGERLHAKSDIAAELAYRDSVIAADHEKHRIELEDAGNALISEVLARKKAERIAAASLEALRHLHDAQNGPPLLSESAERFWNEAMEKTRAALALYEGVYNSSSAVAPEEKEQKERTSI